MCFGQELDLCELLTATDSGDRSCRRNSQNSRKEHQNRNRRSEQPQGIPSAFHSKKWWKIESVRMKPKTKTVPSSVAKMIERLSVGVVLCQAEHELTMSARFRHCKRLSHYQSE